MTEVEEIEEGWCFSTADFSLVNNRVNGIGVVMLVRVKEQRELWYKIANNADEEDWPALYVKGEGKTLAEAISSANKAARAVGLLDPRSLNLTV